MAEEHLSVDARRSSRSSDHSEALPKGLVGVLALTMVCAASGSFVIGVLAPFLSEEGISAAQLGFLPSALYGVAAAGSVVSGRLATGTRSPRTWWAASVGLSGGGALVFASAPAFSRMLGATLVLGCALALANPITNRVLWEGVAPRKRSSAMGIKQSGVPLAALAAGLVLPSVAEAFGWRYAVGGTAALPALVLVLILVRRDRFHNATASAQRKGHRRLVLPNNLMTITGIVGGVSGCINTFLVIYSVDAVGLHPIVGGFLTAIVAVVGSASRVVATTFVRNSRSGSMWLRSMGLVATASVAILVLGPNVPRVFLFFAAAMAGFGIFAYSAVGMAVLLYTVGDGELPGATGHFSRALFIGQIIGPVLFGLAADAYGYRIAWALVLVSSLFAVGTSMQMSFLGPGRRAPA